MSGPSHTGAIDGVRTLTLTIEGTPLSQPRPRVVNGGKHVYMPDRYIAYRGMVTMLARNALQLQGRTEPDADGHYKLSAWFYRKGKAGMDLDKALATIMDALEGVVYVTDRQVTELGQCGVKLGARKPRVEFKIERLEA